MAYWMVTCSVYLYIAILGAKVRICRGQGGCQLEGSSGQRVTGVTIMPTPGTATR